MRKSSWMVSHQGSGFQKKKMKPPPSCCSLGRVPLCFFIDRYVRPFAKFWGGKFEVNPMTGCLVVHSQTKILLKLRLASLAKTTTTKETKYTNKNKTSASSACDFFFEIFPQKIEIHPVVSPPSGTSGSTSTIEGRPKPRSWSNKMSGNVLKDKD